MFVVVLLAAAASFAVVMRVLMTEEDIDEEDAFFGLEQLHMGKYEFILSYFVEFVLALFIYYPLFQFALFSGMLDCLGCGQVRFLGGRPFEMRQLERQHKRERRQQR